MKPTTSVPDCVRKSMTSLSYHFIDLSTRISKLDDINLKICRSWTRLSQLLDKNTKCSNIIDICTLSTLVSIYTIIESFT